MKNYRKAKKGDIRCQDCGLSRVPTGYPCEKRYRCILDSYDPENQYNAPVVAKNGTCDFAEAQK